MMLVLRRSCKDERSSKPASAVLRWPLSCMPGKVHGFPNYPPLYQGSPINVTFRWAGLLGANFKGNLKRLASGAHGSCFLEGSS